MPDGGECSEFALGGGGAEGVFQIVGYTRLCSYSHLCCLSLMDIPCILVKRQSTLGFQTTSNFFPVYCILQKLFHQINNLFVDDRLQVKIIQAIMIPFLYITQHKLTMLPLCLVTRITGVDDFTEDSDDDDDDNEEPENDDDPDWTPEKLDEVYQELGDDNVNDSQTTKPRYCIGRTITY